MKTGGARGGVTGTADIGAGVKGKNVRMSPPCLRRGSGGLTMGNSGEGNGGADGITLVCGEEITVGEERDGKEGGRVLDGVRDRRPDLVEVSLVVERLVEDEERAGFERRRGQGVEGRGGN